MRAFILLITLLYAGTKSSNGAEWTYDNQADWPGLCNTGHLQSPINIQTDEVSPSEFPPFFFENYEHSYHMTLSNNGHSVETRLAFPSSHILVSGGPLIQSYKLDNIHYHWQSEHTINGRRYPLESHMVLFSSNFDNLTEALGVPGGVAVMGVLYDLDEDVVDNEQLSLVFDNMPLGEEQDSETAIDLPLTNFLPTDLDQYFSYEGSLTTPQCNEGIQWIIFSETIPISNKQVMPFLTIPSNYRELQSSNDRIIHIN